MSLYRVIGASALASLVSGAWGSNNGTSTTPAPGKLEKPTGLISIPLKRANSLAGGSTSIQRRFFQSNVLGVYGAAYLAESKFGANNHASSFIYPYTYPEAWYDKSNNTAVR